MGFTRSTTTDSPSGYSAMVPLSASYILTLAATWQASISWTTANVVIAGCVVYSTAVNLTGNSAPVITAVTPVTFNGASYPYTYGTAGGELFTDPIALQLDSSHDYFLVIYVTSGTVYAGAQSGAGNNVPQWQDSPVGCGYLLGNHVNLSVGGTVPNFSGAESDWFRVLRET
jgi:hypothetical protein